MNAPVQVVQHFVVVDTTWHEAWLASAGGAAGIAFGLALQVLLFSVWCRRRFGVWWV